MIDWTAVSNYPGAELVLPGLRDAAPGRVTIASCLVRIARPLIEGSGSAEHLPSLIYVAEPEHALYRLLGLPTSLTIFPDEWRAEIVRDPSLRLG